ncbi:MAG: hypothetical protein AAGI91_16445 [Bacteroidota bacterium]
MPALARADEVAHHPLPELLRVGRRVGFDERSEAVRGRPHVGGEDPAPRPILRHVEVGAGRLDLDAAAEPVEERGAEGLERPALGEDDGAEQVARAFEREVARHPGERVDLGGEDAPVPGEGVECERPRIAPNLSVVVIGSVAAVANDPVERSDRVAGEGSGNGEPGGLGLGKGEHSVGREVRVRVPRPRPQPEPVAGPVLTEPCQPCLDDQLPVAAERVEVEGVEKVVADEKRADAGGLLFEAAVGVLEEVARRTAESGEGRGRDGDAEAAEARHAAGREREGLLRLAVGRGEGGADGLRRREGDGERRGEGVALAPEPGGDLHLGLAGGLRCPGKPDLTRFAGIEVDRLLGPAAQRHAGRLRRDGRLPRRVGAVGDEHARLELVVQPGEAGEGGLEDERLRHHEVGLPGSEAVGGESGRHQPERRQALGQPKGHARPAARVRLERRGPVRERAEVFPQQVRPVAPAAAQGFLLLTEVALADEVRQRLARRHRERARAVERIERIGERVADQVEHARIGSRKGDLAGHAAPAGIGQPEVDRHLVAGPRLLRSLDLNAEPPVAGIDAERGVAHLERRRACIVCRRGRGRPALEKYHADEGVGQVLFAERHLDLRRTPFERHYAARQNAFALDRDEGRRGLVGRLHHDLCRLAGRVGRLVGDEVDPVVVGARPRDVARAGGVEVGFGADRVAAHVARAGADEVRAALGDGQRDPRETPGGRREGLLAHRLLGQLAPPPQPSVAADLAHAVPLPADQLDPHGSVTHRRAHRVDRHDIDPHRALIAQVEERGTWAKAYVEQRRVERDTHAPRLLLPRRVGDGPFPRQVRRPAALGASNGEAKTERAVGCEHRVAAGNRLVAVAVLEWPEAVGVEAGRCEARWDAPERVADRLPAHLRAKEVAPRDRPLEEVADDVGVRRRPGIDGKRGPAERLDAERPGGEVAALPRAALGGEGVGGVGDADGVDALRRTRRSSPVEVERAARARAEAAVEDSLVARAAEEDADAVADGLPVAVGSGAEDAFQEDGLAGAVEAPVGEDAARLGPGFGAPVVVHVEAVWVEAVAVERGGEGEVAVVLGEDVLLRLVPAVGLLQPQPCPARRRGLAVGVRRAGPRHAVVAAAHGEADARDGFRRGEFRHEEEVLVRAELGRDSEPRHLRKRPAVGLTRSEDLHPDDARLAREHRVERKRHGRGHVAGRTGAERLPSGGRLRLGFPFVEGAVPVLAVVGAQHGHDLIGAQLLQTDLHSLDVRQAHR